MEENEVQNMPTENKLFGKTFFWMFLRLLGSALIAWYTYSSGLFFTILLEDSFTGLLIIELVAVLLFSFLFRKLPPIVVGILYFIYAALNGVTLSVIFAVFELNSIITLFIASALIFGILSLIGYKTNKDLSKTKLFGLKYIKQTNELEKHNLKKVSISKTSIILFIIFIALGIWLIFLT